MNILEDFTMTIDENLIIQNVPQEMKSKPNWVCHRNKVPVDAKNGKNASCHERNRIRIAKRYCIIPRNP